MKLYRYILIPVIAFLTALPVLADGNSDDSDSGDSIIIINPEKGDTSDRKARVPAYPFRSIHYSAGMISCTDWPETDDTLDLIICEPDGAILFETMCLPSDLQNGIFIGHIESFTLSITTSSGATYIGYH